MDSRKRTNWFTLAPVQPLKILSPSRSHRQGKINRLITKVIEYCRRGLKFGGAVVSLGLLIGGLGILSGANPVAAAPEPKFQGIPLQCYLDEVNQAGIPANVKVGGLLEIANKYKEAQAPKTALDLLGQSATAANTIENPSTRAFALQEIAHNYSRNDAPTAAVPLLDQAVPLINEFKDPIDQTFAKIKVAYEYQQAGQTAAGSKLLESALADAQQISDPYARARALTAVANVFTELGQDFQSEVALKTAAANLEAITDAQTQARVRVEIAGSYALAKNDAQSALALKQAFATLDKDTTLEAAAKADFQAKAFGLVAAEYIQGKNLDQALRVINNIADDSIEKPLGLVKLAEKYRPTDATKSKLLLEDTVTKLTPLPMNVEKVLAYGEVARQYRELGDKPAAQLALQAATRFISGITNNEEKIFVMTNIANNYSELGQKSSAETLLGQAASLAANVTDSTIKSRALADISGVYWATGNTTKAQNTLAQVENPIEKDSLNKLFTCAGS